MPYCVDCEYKCEFQSEFNRHCETSKHIENEELSRQREAKQKQKTEERSRKEAEERALETKKKKESRVVSFDELSYNKIKDKVVFNFKWNMDNDKWNIFTNLLKAILDVPEYKCMRIKDGQIEMLESTREWTTHKWGLTDDPDMKFTSEDVLHRLNTDIMDGFPQFETHKKNYSFVLNGPIERDLNNRLKELYNVINKYSE